MRGRKCPKRDKGQESNLRDRWDVISRSKVDVEVELKGHSPCTSESKIYSGLKQTPKLEVKL